MCDSIAANLTSTVCNGNGNCSSVDNCTCNSGYIGKYCELNCNSLYYYIDLTNTLNKTLNDVKILNQNLNETLKNLTIKNDENEKLLKSVNELNLNLSNKIYENQKLINDLNITNNNLFQKNFENEKLNLFLNETLKNLKIKNIEIEILNKNLIGLIIGLGVATGAILFSIIFIIIFIVIFVFVIYKFIKYKKNLEFEKLLSGEKNKNINLEKFIDLKEDDFKIELKDIKIIEEIGQGTSAIVFKGKSNNDFVAIKMFKQTVFNSDINDFKKELKLISKLKNSNIVNFIGFIVEKTQFGIVLEYCELKTLKSFIEEKPDKLKFKLKLKLLLDISKGMEYSL
jgi:uncharacterized membrane protein